MTEKLKHQINLKMKPRRTNLQPAQGTHLLDTNIKEKQLCDDQ